MRSLSESVWSMRTAYWFKSKTVPAGASRFEVADVKFGKGCCALIKACATGFSRLARIVLLANGWRMKRGLSGDTACAALKSGLATVVFGSKICPARTHCPDGVPFGL